MTANDAVQRARSIEGQPIKPRCARSAATVSWQPDREPSAKLELMVFIMFTKTNASFLREAKQCKTEKTCCNYEK